MESPLDVLSRAASMVETTYTKGDPVLSSCPGIDTYDLPPGKDLPTRSLKADRLKDRQDLSQVLHIDADHAASIHARKTVTASTQTQFSSFNGEAPPYPGPPPGPPPAYFAPRGEPLPGDGYPPVHPMYRPPPPLPPIPPHTSSVPSPPSPPPVSSHLTDLSHTQGRPDVQNAPLNLSLSTSSAPVSPAMVTARQPPRPSVITCMSSSSSPPSNGESSPRLQNGHRSQNGHSSPTDNGPPVSLSDPAIEEHFRRSLGRSYGDSIPKTTPATIPATDQVNVSITESVDDHFAKALGDSTWKAIKSQNDPALDIFTGSVDDHFAKALGVTTWRRIKAETEHTDNPTSAFTNNSGNSSNNHSPSSSTSATPPHPASSLSAPVAT